VEGSRAVEIKRWFGLLAIKLAIARPMPEEQPVTIQNKRLIHLPIVKLKGESSLNQAASSGSLYGLVLTGFILTQSRAFEATCKLLYLF